MVDAAIGISAYKRQQDVLIRLIRKNGILSSSKFDCLFFGREAKRPAKVWNSTKDSFIVNLYGCTEWVRYLSLLQAMVAAGIVDTVTCGSGEVSYVLPTTITGIRSNELISMDR